MVPQPRRPSSSTSSVGDTTLISRHRTVRL
jgi:hypothetical protein